MSERLNELGLSPKLAEAAAAAGYEIASPLQQAAIPVLRRGSNAVLHGSPGAGVVLAYGLAVLDRLGREGEPSGGDAPAPGSPRALVIVPTVEASGRIAESLARIANRIGMRVTALASGWPGLDREADVVVGSPRTCMRGVESAKLKAEALETLVVDGVSDIIALGEKPALETLAGTIPRDAQRIMVSAEFDRDVESFLQARVRRAQPIPSKPA
jgi:superfamily II DNA/RNA helicase